MMTILLTHRNATFVDIGANVGSHTLAMAASGAAQHVHAFEAAPRNLLLLDESVRLNKLDSRVTLYAAALGARSGLVRLGRTFNANEGNIRNSERAGGVQLPRVALDSILDPIAQPVFVKVDIEGAECAALHGARKFMYHSRIVGFAIEIFQSRACCAEWCASDGLFHGLKARGLCVYSIVERPPKLTPLDMTRCTNWCSNTPRANPQIYDIVFVPCNVHIKA